MNDTDAALIQGQSERLTAYVIDEDYRRRPELVDRYGPRGRELCLRDNSFHVSFLAEAVASDVPALFVDYVVWARSMLEAHGVRAEDFQTNLNLLCEALEHHLPAASEAAVATIRRAQAELPRLPMRPATFMEEGAPHSALTRRYLECLMQGDRSQAAELVGDAVAGGLPLEDLYLDVFQRSQREVGRLWQLNEMTVAEEHFCTAATQSIMNQFYRQVLATPRNGLRVTALCATGDLHEVGLRIIADCFELAGWDCDYLGANTPTPAVLAQLVQRRPDLLAISATISYHVRPIADLIAEVRRRPELKDIPILVGGRPFLVAEQLWRRIGADGCAADAKDAVILGRELVSRAMARG